MDSEENMLKARRHFTQKSDTVLEGNLIDQTGGCKGRRLQNYLKDYVRGRNSPWSQSVCVDANQNPEHRVVAGPFVPSAQCGSEFVVFDDHNDTTGHVVTHKA